MYDLSRGIQFKDVHFTYPSRPDMPIFQGLNLDVPAGSITAVVGPSGSGKRTLGSLLLRLYDPELGQVIVGGHDVRVLSPDWLRGAVGTVHQVCVDINASFRISADRHSILLTGRYFKLFFSSFAATCRTSCDLLFIKIWVITECQQWKKHVTKGKFQVPGIRE